MKTGLNSNGPNYLYLLLVVFAPFALLSPILLFGKAMFWGTVSLQFLPWIVQAYHSILQGQIPLWNPLVGMGAPLAANYQSALFYPPNWLVLVLEALGGVGWAAWGQTLLVAIHLAWAGIGMAMLARRLGLNSLAQAVCGLAYGLSAYLVARSGFLSINAAAAWVPWVIYGVTELTFMGNSFPNISKLSIVLGLLFLSGHAQIAWYTLLLAYIWSGYWSLRIAYSHNYQFSANMQSSASGNLGFTRLIKVWFGLSLSVVLGGCLAAVQLLPTVELLRQSQRAIVVDYAHAMTYSFWPWRFLTLFAPNLFGSPVSNNYWGYGNYWEDALYIGLLPAIVALMVLLSAIWQGINNKKQIPTAEHSINSMVLNRGFIYFLLGLIVVSFILALGVNTPIYPWLYRNIPTFALFQAPARFSLWAEFSLVLLAGIGVNCWRRPTGKALYWTRLATAGAGAITIGAALTWYLMGTVSPTFLKAIAVMGMIGVGVGALSLLAPEGDIESRSSDKGEKVWGWAVLTLVSVDLLLANWGLNPGIDQNFYTETSASNSKVQELSSGGRLYLAANDEYLLKYDRFMRFDKYFIGERWQNLRSVLLPNLNVLDAIPSVNNFDPLLPVRYVTWMDKLNQLQTDPDNPTYHLMLDLMDVNVIEKIDSTQNLGVSFQPVSTGKRLRWVPCAKFVSNGDQAWDTLFVDKLDFDNQVILEGMDYAGGSACPQKPVSATVQWITDTPNRIIVEVNSPVEGWLVLSDVWYPGWQADVSGATTPVIRANYLFRAVKAPPGVNQVVFTYRPISFWLGLVVSILVLFGFGIGWLIYKRFKGTPVS
jgi:Bacterial membrane protein YfhO